jgi:phosphatidylserine/phosphatidylglycerophosphate/cardiolipin synthase-like enzyme
VTPVSRLEAKYFGADPLVSTFRDTHLEPLIDGIPYMREVQSAIKRTTSGDVILHSSLRLDPAIDLLGRRPGSAGYESVAQLLVDKAHDGVGVWILLSYGVITGALGVLGRFSPFRGNAIAAETLRHLTPSADVDAAPPLANRVLLDWSGRLIGSNHQKFTVVKTGATVSAFEGGIDFADSRLDQAPHATRRLRGERWGWHDGGIVLRGPAARAVWETFGMRWRETSTLPARYFWIAPLTLRRVNPSTPTADPGVAPKASPARVRPRSVQIIRSFGPWKIDSMLRSRRRRWNELPHGGVQEVFATHTRALDAASRYVYVEDQYFAEMLGGDARFELFPHFRRCVEREVKVIFVGSGTRDPDDNSLTKINRTLNADIRKKILDRIGPAFRRNFVMYRVENLTVHTKLLIIDDEFASIGSANVFSRSMAGTDHELSAAVVAEDEFVRDVRVALWAEHLRTDPSQPEVRKALSDIDTALGVWRSEWLPAGQPGTMWKVRGSPPGFDPTERVLTRVPEERRRASV